MLYRVAVMTSAESVRTAAEEAFSGKPVLLDILEKAGTPAAGTQAIILADGAVAEAAAAISAVAAEQHALITLLSDAVDAREDVPLGASARAADHAARFAAALSLSQEDSYRLVRATLLRGVGKLRINNQVLLKKSLLSYDDWLLIRSHPILGAELLQERGLAGDLLDIIHYHNECFDGTGYPNGLEGNAIPFLARVLHLVDVYCAMTSPRHYRTGHATRDAALAHLRAEHGKHFDPHLVDVFIDADIAREYGAV